MLATGNWLLAAGNWLLANYCPARELSFKMFYKVI